MNDLVGIEHVPLIAAPIVAVNASKQEFGVSRFETRAEEICSRTNHMLVECNGDTELHDACADFFDDRF